MKSVSKGTVTRLRENASPLSSPQPQLGTSAGFSSEEQLYGAVEDLATAPSQHKTKPYARNQPRYFLVGDICGPKDRTTTRTNSVATSKEQKRHTLRTASLPCNAWRVGSFGQRNHVAQKSVSSKLKSYGHSSYSFLSVLIAALELVSFDGSSYCSLCNSF